MNPLKFVVVFATITFCVLEIPATSTVALSASNSSTYQCSVTQTVSSTQTSVSSSLSSTHTLTESNSDSTTISQSQSPSETSSATVTPSVTSLSRSRARSNQLTATTSPSNSPSQELSASSSRALATRTFTLKMSVSQSASKEVGSATVSFSEAFSSTVSQSSKLSQSQSFSTSVNVTVSAASLSQSLTPSNKSTVSVSFTTSPTKEATLSTSAQLSPTFASFSPSDTLSMSPSRSLNATNSDSAVASLSATDTVSRWSPSLTFSSVTNALLRLSASSTGGATLSRASVSLSRSHSISLSRSVRFTTLSLPPRSMSATATPTFADAQTCPPQTFGEALRVTDSGALTTAFLIATEPAFVNVSVTFWTANRFPRNAARGNTATQVPLDLGILTGLIDTETIRAFLSLGIVEAQRPSNASRLFCVGHDLPIESFRFDVCSTANIVLGDSVRLDDNSGYSGLPSLVLPLRAEGVFFGTEAVACDCLIPSTAVSCSLFNGGGSSSYLLRVPLLIGYDLPSLMAAASQRGAIVGGGISTTASTTSLGFMTVVVCVYFLCAVFDFSYGLLRGSSTSQVLLFAPLIALPNYLVELYCSGSILRLPFASATSLSDFNVNNGFVIRLLFPFLPSDVANPLDGLLSSLIVSGAMWALGLSAYAAGRFMFRLSHSQACSFSRFPGIWLRSSLLLQPGIVVGISLSLMNGEFLAMRSTLAPSVGISFNVVTGVCIGASVYVGLQLLLLQWLSLSIELHVLRTSHAPDDKDAMGTCLLSCSLLPLWNSSVDGDELKFVERCDARISRLKRHKMISTMNTAPSASAKVAATFALLIQRFRESEGWWYPVKCAAAVGGSVCFLRPTAVSCAALWPLLTTAVCLLSCCGVVVGVGQSASTAVIVAPFSVAVALLLIGVGLVMVSRPHASSVSGIVDGSSMFTAALAFLFPITGVAQARGDWVVQLALLSLLCVHVLLTLSSWFVEKFSALDGDDVELPTRLIDLEDSERDRSSRSPYRTTVWSLERKAAENLFMDMH